LKNEKLTRRHEKHEKELFLRAVPSCEKDMSTILKPVAVSKVLPVFYRQIKLNK
jgi:hypothetical protein